MDTQKTGQVIAGRRAELGLTQKQLAERLHISDRTVSRWERGVGFPDLSLLEPLADALELSVLELLRGERSSPAEQPAPEPERSVREVFRAQALLLKRFKALIIVLAVLVAGGGAALAWMSAHHPPTDAPNAVTAEQAAAICPDILITTDEYELLAELLKTDEIQAAISDDASTLSAENVVILPDEFSAPYRERLQVGGELPDYLQIEVLGSTLSLEYGTALSSRILCAAAPANRMRVIKYAAQYSTEENWVFGTNAQGEETSVSLGRDPSCLVSNQDNLIFSASD